MGTKPAIRRRGGRGERRAPLRVVLETLYFLGMLAEVAIRTPHERRRRRTRIAIDRADATERSLLGSLFVGVFLLPAVYAFTPWLDGADYRLPAGVRGWVGGVGAAIMALAVWVFWRSHADLGRNWSPSLQLREGHTLVVRGVYGRVRHPMYASQWLWSAGQALLLQNWIAGPSGLVSFLPLYLSRVPREERMMLEQFGEEYRAYMRRTGRVIPRLGSRGG